MKKKNYLYDPFTLVMCVLVIVNIIMLSIAISKGFKHQRHCDSMQATIDSLRRLKQQDDLPDSLKMDSVLFDHSEINEPVNQ